MKKIGLLLPFLALGLSIASCTKEGCTNIEATNYSPDANQNDGSCSYKGNIVFWASPVVSDSLISLGHDFLRFEVEGEYVDSISTAVFFAAGGECNLTGTITNQRTFVGDTKRYYKYRVKGAGFETLQEDIILLNANDCEAVEIVID